MAELSRRRQEWLDYAASKYAEQENALVAQVAQR